MAMRARIEEQALQSHAKTELDEGDDGVVYLTQEEAVALFEEDVQRELGISGAEFLRRLDAGEYDDIYDDPKHRYIGHLEMWSHFVR